MGAMWPLEPKDTGSTGAEPHPMRLTCTVCAWSASDVSAVKVVAAAQRHARENDGHEVSYRGHIQEWSRRQHD